MHLNPHWHRVSGVWIFRRNEIFNSGFSKRNFQKKIFVSRFPKKIFQNEIFILGFSFSGACFVIAVLNAPFQKYGFQRYVIRLAFVGFGILLGRFSVCGFRFGRYYS
jgi:hypothetical protein